MKRFIKLVLLLTAFATFGSLSGNTGDERELKFYHTHTEKNLQLVYYRNGEYVPEALSELKVFLADWRDAQQHEINPAVFDILWQLQQAHASGETWEAISAYRSPETNKLLRSRSSGVAKKSQHLLGNAIDVRLRGVDLKDLYESARDLKLGGVGYYPGSDFLHVDTGRVRYW